MLRFTSVQQVVQLESTIREYIAEAIELEKSGAKVDFKAKSELVIPEELQRKFEQLPALQSAFEALTPVDSVATFCTLLLRNSRKPREADEKCIPRILEGKGMHD